MHLVIVGNGVAGMEAALTVRERHPDWEITIVSEESDHFFSRTALMWVVTGQLSHRCIEPHERDLYQRMGFKRVRARATGIHAKERRLLLGGQDPLSYDRLLIACGSRPRPGPWPGSSKLGVGHFVTLQDLEWLEGELHGGPSHGGRPPNPDVHVARSDEGSPYWPRKLGRSARGKQPTRAAVIGGGLIGIEAIEVMVEAGLQPHFFIREDWFWPIALDEKESTWISERMQSHGVNVRLNENVKELEGDSFVDRIVTDQGSYDTDLVVVAIGVLPNTGWLRDTPGVADNEADADGTGALVLDRTGGILVNDRFETGLPGVFAAGDCASVRWFNGWQRPEQLWYTARDQGRLAGRAICGDDVRYDRGPWYNSAKLMDIEYTTAGLVNMRVEHERNWFYEEVGPVRSTNRIVLSGDRVVGFNFLGRRWDHTVLNRWIAERRPLDFVLARLEEARFDTEFVPPLRIPDQVLRQKLSGPSTSSLTQPTKAPVH